MSAPRCYSDVVPGMIIETHRSPWHLAPGRETDADAHVA